MFKQRIALVVVAVLIVFIFLAIPTRFSSSWRSALMQLCSPLVKLENGIIGSLSAVKKAWVTRRRLARENVILKNRVKEIEHENLALCDLKQENERLLRLINFSASSARRLIPAQVIGRDTLHWYSSVIINRGLGDGIAPDMAVVSEGGVVGKVIEAGPSVSKVLLIVDKRSRVGGIIQRTREMGVVKGTSFNTCNLDYLPRQAEARSGDRVLTSGLGGVYPKGLYIGEVARIYEGEHGLFRYADVLPGVNFAAIEEVHVMSEQVEGEEDFLR